MLADVRHIGNNLQRLVAHVLRMGGGKADTHLGGLFRYVAQEVWETYAPCVF